MSEDEEIEEPSSCKEDISAGHKAEIYAITRMPWHTWGKNIAFGARLPRDDSLFQKRCVFGDFKKPHCGKIYNHDTVVRRDGRGGVS